MSTASTLRAAADRKIAPTLVGFTTCSRIAMRRLSAASASQEGRSGLFMAASIPRVKTKPVSCRKTSSEAV